MQVLEAGKPAGLAVLIGIDTDRRDSAPYALVCRRRLRLRRAHERAHELAVDLGRERVDVESFASEELARVFDVVDAGRLDADR